MGCRLTPPGILVDGKSRAKGERMAVTVLVPDEEGRAALAGLDSVEPVVYDPGVKWPEQAPSAEVLVVPWQTDTRGGVLAGLRDLPTLRMVQTLSAGYEAWEGQLPDGVLLVNGRGAHGRSSAELVMAGLLAVYPQGAAVLAPQGRQPGGRARPLQRRAGNGRAAGRVPAGAAVPGRPGRAPVGPASGRDAGHQTGAHPRRGGPGAEPAGPAGAVRRHGDAGGTVGPGRGARVRRGAGPARPARRGGADGPVQRPDPPPGRREVPGPDAGPGGAGQRGPRAGGGPRRAAGRADRGPPAGRAGRDRSGTAATG